MAFGDPMDGESYQVDLVHTCPTGEESQIHTLLGRTIRDERALQCPTCTSTVIVVKDSMSSGIIYLADSKPIV